MQLQDVVNDRAYDYKYMYKRMWPYVKPYWFRGLLGVLLAIPVGLLDGSMAIALKPFLDNVVGGKDLVINLANLKATFLNQFLSISINEIIIPSEDLKSWIPFLIIGITLAQGLLVYFSAYLNDWAGIKMSIGLKRTLFAKLLTFESALYDKNSSGLVQNRFLGDADGACSGIIVNAKALLQYATSALGLIFVLLFMSWKLALFSVIIMSAAFLPASLIRKHIKHVSMEGMNIGSSLSTSIYETFNGNRIITAFNLQNYQQNKIMKKLQESFELQMSFTKRVAWLSPMMRLICSFGFAGTLWYGLHLIATGEMTSGSFAAFATASLLLYRPIKTLGNTLTGMQGSFVAMNRVMDALDLEPNIKNSPDAVKINTIKDSINFEKVWFEYDEDAPVLKDVSFDIKIGQSLALVGNSGGGKTTIANLIPRFYDIKSGFIKIDGVDVRKIEMESLRQNISVVFQDNFLFTGSIRENIVFGKFNATEQELKQAVKDAYLEDFIAELPDGLDTEIGERGVRLSGGQKQRVAIARAMLKNAPVVILDEATSALDNKSEAIVQKAMDKLMENRTVIVIAHRLSTIQNVDKIAVINDGQIIEMGSHEELMKNPQGAYSILYNAQFKENEVQYN